MAKFFYANTWHPELFSKVNGTPNRLKTVEYEGKKWVYIPRGNVAWIIFPSGGLNDCYISFEYALPPFNKEIIHPDYDVQYRIWSEVNTQSYVCVASTATASDGSNYTTTLMEIDRQHTFSGNNNEDATKSLYKQTSGNISWKVTSKSGLGGLGDTIGTSSCKILATSGVFDTYYKGFSFITSYGRGNKSSHFFYSNNDKFAYLYASGVYIRNIIISEEPISFSDTIREVTVDSITGSGWYTSNGKSYTENVNAPATVKLNSASLAEAKRVVDARKFAFSGISNRQGERINALEVKRANEAHQSLVDIGEHTFGSSWSVNSPSEITDTLTITSRKVVGK